MTSSPFLVERRFTVECWAALADSVSELHRGSQVAVEGRLRQNEYTDREGSRRQAVLVCPLYSWRDSWHDSWHNGGSIPPPPMIK